MKSLIQTPTPDLKSSLDFYRKLGFTVISEEGPTLISDGGALVEINPERYARAGVKLFSNSWKDTVNKLNEFTTVVETASGYALSDRSGTWIYLNEVSGEDHKLSEIPRSKLGNFAGLSLETIGIETSVKIWQTLGFTIKAGTAEQGWVSLSHEDGLAISLMKPFACPHLFFNPSLTYFNGKENMAVIEKVREAGIPITEEITHFNKEGIVDNLIIRDPGGLGFFLFND